MFNDPQVMLQKKHHRDFKARVILPAPPAGARRRVECRQHDHADRRQPFDDAFASPFWRAQLL
jgi:hypothetical protein